MKIAVYGIAKNEAKNAKQWAQSCQEADYRVVTDTGSVDQTRDILAAEGVEVRCATVYPWRFDKARNLSLSHVREDTEICISLDLDEVLSPGWRQVIERVWKSNTTQLNYIEITRWKPDGVTPSEMVYGSKIHSRHGYYWKYALHETLFSTGQTSIEVTDELKVLHNRDEGKSRDFYWKMLQELVQDEPHESRYAFFLGQEYMQRNLLNEAITELERFLKIENFYRNERSYVYRLIARCQKLLGGSPQIQFYSLLRGAQESPMERESWAELAFLLADLGDWSTCLMFTRRALEIKKPSVNSMIIRPICWNGQLEQLYNHCGRQLGLSQEKMDSLL